MVRLFTGGSSDSEVEVKPVFGWLKRMLGRDEKAPISSGSRRPRKHNIKVRCPSCGYEADESEFLQQDPGDTICPKCGEDTTIYEM
jgi:hypothetical protein